MRAAAVLFAFAFAASASTEPRVIGRISQEDVREITAAIRAVAPDRIVWIRATRSADRVGVQTESGPDAGCHYLVERSGGDAWHVGTKSCWTHTQPWPDYAAKKWPHVARPSELSESDFAEIKRVVGKQTHDEIRTIKVSRSPLSVQVHTASPHVVTEGDFILHKIGAHWQITKKDEWIH